MSTTTDISKFGWLEISKLRDLLNAWLDQGLPEDFVQDEVHPMFNQNSGNVFLTNSEYQSGYDERRQLGIILQLPRVWL